MPAGLHALYSAILAVFVGQSARQSSVAAPARPATGALAAARLKCVLASDHRALEATQAPKPAQAAKPSKSLLKPLGRAGQRGKKHARRRQHR